MSDTFIIGLDYGSESARGVLLDAASGLQVASHTHPYRHGIMTRQLTDGTALPGSWALQNAADYLEAAQIILAKLGRARRIASIGVGFTASSPMPATLEGTALSQLQPHNPHAYVKLWKHGAAQQYADAINARGGDFLQNFGGRLSGEWLLAKAVQIATESPATWQATDKFIESGDWLVWQLTGIEARSLGFAAYKAQYRDGDGYPDGILPDLDARLAPPRRIGSPAGALTAAWRRKTGIEGHAVVAVAVIDSHVVLPAVGAVKTGCLVGALGTSAAYLLLSERFRPLPAGIEGVAKDASVRDLWCYEAGQASFGDTLSWFVKQFPRADTHSESFRRYNHDAAACRPDESRLVALDWWNGNRVPLADSRLRGMLVGIGMDTTATALYRALMESLCFGARTIADLFAAGGIGIERVLMTSGLARNNPLLVQIMADVLARPVDVPELDNPTAVGAAIHGAVAGGLAADYHDGAARFGARSYRRYRPDPANTAAYAPLYDIYRNLAASADVRGGGHTQLTGRRRIASRRHGTAKHRARPRRRHGTAKRRARSRWRHETAMRHARSRRRRHSTPARQSVGRLMAFYRRVGYFFI
ncbi:FGGY-family carbohydrate kinase [Acerihabitans sp. KWT182]|uniref:FGGY-family carbohydrate kinase n=1 Tax=Acerihabitans sp. KWT182 TaxID=3157919 RepID=A0AAU7QEV3_9GAMM